MIRRFLLLMVAAALFGAACDRVPTDPSFNVEYLLNADPSVTAGIKPLSSTLPALFREAVREANTRQGRLGADALLSDWRSLQQELKAHAPGSDRAEIQSKLAAIHNEELSIVVSALGNRAVVRTLSDTRVNLAETQAQIANEAARGIDAGQASVVITQVKEKLNSAERALNAGDNIAALDYGTQAAALLSGLDFYLIETRRIPGLESLYPKAVEKLSGEPNVSARGLMNDLSQINADARNALRAGDRWVAQAKLKQARDYQIQLVLRVLGAQAATDLVDTVTKRATQLRDSLTVIKAAGVDTRRFERMLNEAADLGSRARAAADKGDLATSLDLGSHAAGMLNALQHLAHK
jgi:hypothetical protein